MWTMHLRGRQYICEAGTPTVYVLLMRDDTSMGYQICSSCAPHTQNALCEVRASATCMV